MCEKCALCGLRLTNFFGSWTGSGEICEKCNANEQVASRIYESLEEILLDSEPYLGTKEKTVQAMRKVLNSPAFNELVKR